jgi:excinuclease ABC subunit A
VKILEMQFLAPVEVVCEDCSGSRFNPETMEIEFKDKNVSDLLDMTIEDAGQFFANFPKIMRALSTLEEVGLGYLRLGQPSTTLSGGEAQRIKLASELQRPATGRTVYLLDEPTTGLHFEDIRRLLSALQRLVDAGNSVIVIEHNLDVIKSADHIIDLGPEGGPGGGRLVAAGTPEQVARKKSSHTGKALASLLNGKGKKKAGGRKNPKRARSPENISVKGARKNNLRAVDLQIPLDQFTVVTGVSGSGKSSLAFDTLFAEGQRRFVESLSTYARRFLGRFDRAPVDKLEGLGPAIAIDQRASQSSPRSTVATSTEIHDYLRLLFARIGRPYCPWHEQELVQHAPNQIARDLLKDFPGERGYMLAPLHLPENLLGSKKKMDAYLEGLRERWREHGFLRALFDGEEHRLEKPMKVTGSKAWPEVLLIIDRLAVKDRGRLVDGAAQAAVEGHGRVLFRLKDGRQRIFSTERACTHCGHSVPKDPHPRYFSFNHHSGACESCAGLGRVVACDPELLVNHPKKPLFGGAVKHKGAAFTFMMRRSGWYKKIAVQVAKEEGFDLELPYEDLPPAAQRALMHGCGKRRFDVVFRRRRARSSRSYEMSVEWKGLARQVEEWYRNKEGDQKAERFQAVMRIGPCGDCDGDRLKIAQRHILVGGKNLPQIARLGVDEAIETMAKMRLRKEERSIAHEVLIEIGNRLRFLSSVGLGYLTLDRSSATLSGGEAQRIRLATQLGNRLVGVLYVLDEPTIGLHPRDTMRLLDTLLELRDQGNTIVAVEHDESVIRRADHVVDMGPGAGHRGGEVVASGTPAQLAKSKGLTGRYLRGELQVPLPSERREPQGAIQLRGARAHNLKKLDVDFPLGVMTAVTGVSGSGKSSLVLDSLLPEIQEGEVKLRGVPALSPIVVDQSPIGSTPASNPATYTGIFTPLRELFAQLPVSKMKGFGPGRFSFNLAGGRCDACEGKGQIRVEMHFLADVWVTCEICSGRRFNAETLSVEYRGRNIAQVLDLEVREACEFFGNHPRVRRPLQLLDDVGLGYLKLGQAANTLSGGEAQRIKLVAQLARNPKEHKLFLLDEPTTGLHLDDVAKLIIVLQRLVDRGDTVIVIEHHLDVIKSADHVIEMGPEAGAAGGELVAQGSPEEIVANKRSQTAPFLAPMLPGKRGRKKSKKKVRSREAS